MPLPTEPVPPLACDCHMHVFGDPAQYPPATARSYTPTAMPLPQYLAMAAALRLQRVVFVQPSAYGTDNSCMLDALGAVPGNRGVAVIDATTTDTELQVMDGLGVRGTRLNLVSNGAPDLAGAQAMLTEAARWVGPLGWHVQMFAGLPLVAALAPFLRDFAVPVVIDHMGLPCAVDGLEQPGFDALLGLLRDEACWVKVAGANRVSAHQTDFSDAAPFARALIAANDQRVVWGTDWPHIASHPATPGADAPPVHYRDLDNADLLQQLWRWTDTAARQRILVDNPAELYRF